MSVNETEDPSGHVDLDLDSNSAFSFIMDALAPEKTDQAGAAGEPPAGAAEGADGQAAPPAAPAGGAPGAPAVGAPGAVGDPVLPGGGAVAPATGIAPVGTGPFVGAGSVDFEDIRDAFGELSVSLEDGSRETHQATALKEVQTEYPKYFEALQMHPRLLIGQEVPAAGKEGMETLRDSQDAADWQEAWKRILAQEVRDRAERKFEGDSDTLRVIHSSIELFQNNADLTPFTKQFDKELADRFVEVAKPYELRVEGKLTGYSIPVQPLVNQLRTQLQTSRAAASTAAAATPVAPVKTGAGRPAAAPAAAAPVAQVPGPQAGIKSSAGASTEEEDYSVLFATLGLPPLSI